MAFRLRRVVDLPASVGRKLLRRRRSRARLGGRGGPEDQPVVTGGDGFQAEPPAVRE